MAVTLTISAVAAVATCPTGQTVRLNGGVGKSGPSPARRRIEVPEAAGEGAVPT